MKKRIVLWLVVVVLLFTWQVAQAAVSGTRLAALKAEITDLKAEIAQLKTYNAQLIERLAKLEVKFKEMVDATDKDLPERNRLNQQFGDNVAKANKRLDSAEASYLALSNKQGALEKEQQALASGYQSAVNAAIQEARRKNQVVNVPSTARAQSREEPQGRSVIQGGIKYTLKSGRVEIEKIITQRENSDDFYARALGISPIDWSFLRRSEKNNGRKNSDSFYARALGISPVDWSFLRR